ncbi:MAG: ATP-binding protein [Candidatus Zixiibacteriota bacterium]|nr:MAG: ATP-binding protein [candidate division Zixibacteria bacterium]
MVYKRFRIACVLRIVLLSMTLLLFFFLLFTTSLYASIVVVAGAVLYQVLSLIFFIERNNRLLTRFLESIEYSDFSQTYTSGLKGTSFDELNRIFSSVMSRFRQIRLEKEENARYLETVVRHVGVGLIAFDENGEVVLFNTAAKRLFDIPNLRNISGLGTVSENLEKRLQFLKPGQRDLVKVYRHEELMQLAIYATELRIRQKKITLVSLQNISSELSEKEMEAWQNLIRVLTHEIKNSITPIGSLASTIEGLLEESGQKQTGAYGADHSHDIKDALQTIQKRSKGLLRFVEAYRNLTHIPTPDYKVLPVVELLKRVEHLTAPQIAKKKIAYRSSIDPESLELTADPELIEQVLINLLLNAIQALEGRVDPEIVLEAILDERGRSVIRVTDNGPGIVDEALEQIFIPFFSTKKGGSGIGLSLSRQIMRLHRGDVTVQSEPQVKTTFTMRF